jgi:hypothetical protein
MADGGGAQRVAAQAWDEHARTRRDQFDVIWRGAVVTVMVVGVVLATVLIVEDQGATRRAQGKDLAAVTDELALLRQEVKDKHGEVTRARARLARSEKSKELETADLKKQLLAKELENAELKKQLQRDATTDKGHLAALLEIAELKKQLSLRAASDKLQSDKGRLSALLEIAELKKQLHLRSASDKQQLSAAKLKDHCQCPTVIAPANKAVSKADTLKKELDTSSQLYKDGMACEKKLSAAKDSLVKTSQELDQKKRDFRRFLQMLQSTWSQTNALKTEIGTLESQKEAISKEKVASVLAGAMAAEAGKESRNDGDFALSSHSDLDDQVLKLLGVVSDAKGQSQAGSSHQSNSDQKDSATGSTPEESDW